MVRNQLHFFINPEQQNSLFEFLYQQKNEPSQTIGVLLPERVENRVYRYGVVIDLAT